MSTAMTVAVGTISCANSSRFGVISVNNYTLEAMTAELRERL
jgi:hypothetical protein